MKIGPHLPKLLLNINGYTFWDCVPHAGFFSRGYTGEAMRPERDGVLEIGELAPSFSLVDFGGALRLAFWPPRRFSSIVVTSHGLPWHSKLVFDPSLLYRVWAKCVFLTPNLSRYATLISLSHHTPIIPIPTLTPVLGPGCWSRPSVWKAALTLHGIGLPILEPLNFYENVRTWSRFQTVHLLYELLTILRINRSRRRIYSMKVTVVKVYLCIIYNEIVWAHG